MRHKPFLCFTFAVATISFQPNLSAADVSHPKTLELALNEIQPERRTRLKDNQQLTDQLFHNFQTTIEELTDLSENNTPSLEVINKLARLKYQCACLPRYKGESQIRSALSKLGLNSLAEFTIHYLAEPSHELNLPPISWGPDVEHLIVTYAFEKLGPQQKVYHLATMVAQYDLGVLEHSRILVQVSTLPFDQLMGCVSARFIYFILKAALITGYFEMALHEHLPEVFAIPQFSDEACRGVTEECYQEISRVNNETRDHALSHLNELKNRYPEISTHNLLRG